MLSTSEINGKWKEYRLSNKNGISVSVLDYGGIITKLMVPDKNGNLENVVLGFKDYQEYESNPFYFGAIIGRVAGRIQGASFSIEDKAYHLEANNNANHLHGGPKGFHQVIWNVYPFENEDAVGLTLTHTSADGDRGYPGNVDVSVTYTLNNHNQLILDYAASSDQTTPLTLTNHSYFNLSGNAKENITNHYVKMDSSKFAELDHTLIPTGKLIDVTGTPFDFRKYQKIGTGFNSSFEQNSLVGNGYDHYFIFDHASEHQVIVDEPHSGRIMKVKTNQPGMVMYTANNMAEGYVLLEGTTKKYQGVCFETQGLPASLHHPGFPSILLMPGKKYKKQTVFTLNIINE
ncbi:aldose epimerase family protein [Bacillus litorisediminis]|uniref:aldose epimerase family protein n=1 Tax=Bacillus litorisediminis TaxID=2922713 RepID=UPI001FAD3C10|nr:aldose epimerase family protein [Bacillus litorisediminis]